ncbi:pentatricopeptide repeat-containing protein [Hibiscus syriacus]|uniref:Pentatricopeptide repeat-containing protein n=1 Tax=Hibiscus syriacus TaxID=106335 RepID=A0A6A2W8Y8_HIBSY|nr:pentatricopeptide repeat-containing protein [Hibiscus syriacus]
MHKKMARAAVEWGFFQIVNHGIPEELLTRLKQEQIKVFQQPFDKKSEDNFLNLSVQSYRWGNPLATCLRNLSWSEVLHISLNDISKMDEYNKLRSTIEEYAEKANVLAQRLAEHLAESLGIKASYFRENCSLTSSSLRLNRYPPCPYSSMMFGIIPHTDTDFLTIVSQDQALSNGVYKSITHRVIANQECERYSAAYFYCPTYETVIESCSNPNLYRKFSFKEYREQIQKDVKATGDKVGLARFLL